MSSLEPQAYVIFKNRVGGKEGVQKNKGKEDVLLIKDDKVELLSKIEAAKTDMVKWFFAFFVTLALMVIGLYFKD